MNHTLEKATGLKSGYPFLPINLAKISPDLGPVLIVRIVVNALTCPLIILLNILVIVTVKTKPQLRTKSNIALACLATTDLVVGLIVQPLHIASSALLFQGKTDTFCSLFNKSYFVSLKCIRASLCHLFLISFDRYVAIKRPFAYENKVTEGCIIFSSGLAWAAAILLPIQHLRADMHISKVIAVYLPLLILLSAITYFNVSIYKEVRRAEKQIAANQVSLDAKEKLLKNKKAFYTTITVLLSLFLCYVPINIFCYTFNLFKESIPIKVKYTVLGLVSLLPVLNSLFNPLIYVARIRYFRVAFIQLLSQKTTSQAEELERKIFRSRQVGVISDVGQRENVRANREEQQGIEAFNNGHETTVRTQPQDVYEESTM